MATIRLNKDKRNTILKAIMADWKQKHPAPVAPKMSAARALVEAFQKRWYNKSGIAEAIQFSGLKPEALNTAVSLNIYVKDRDGKSITTIWEYFRDENGNTVKTYAPNGTCIVYTDEPMYKTYLDNKSAYDRYEIDIEKWHEDRRAQSKVYEAALDQFKTLKQLTDGWEGIEKYLPKEFEQQSTAVAVIPQLP
ncbi:putative nucleotide modification associated domain-containing protein [Vibrio phage vB_VpP_HA7]|uniref:Nucleotide modification associated domain-containing protein n=1 Tax=Vibrio phage vB_VpP_HA5 TaxID=2980504 RepID=A0A977LIA0_9CAUD|nr:putative nucleotide modification associated domain-containing protein [Vibrio phage vB_VpP_HA5]UXF57431.1 putative nucleotide modification associated domain-containing protein [Vibrio phage vB_VpP_HA7]